MVIIAKCTSISLVDAGTTEEERFWAFYKLSDSLYLEYISNNNDKWNYPVDIYLDNTNGLKSLLGIPWYQKLPLREDSLGTITSATVSTTQLGGLLKSDNILFIKHRDHVPQSWSMCFFIESKYYMQWFAAKCISNFFDYRKSGDKLSGFEKRNPIFLILQDATSFRRPHDRNIGQYVTVYRDLNSPIQLRVRIYFTHPVFEDDLRFGEKSSRNSIDGIIGIKELYELVRRIDVACFAYIPWASDLPQELRTEFNGFPEYWDRVAWAKADTSLLNRLLYYNYVSFNSEQQTWPAGSMSSDRHPVRITHCDSPDWRRLLVRDLLSPTRPYPRGLVIPDIPEANRIEDYVSYRRLDGHWYETDSSKVIIHMKYREIERALFSDCVKKVESMGVDQ